MLSASAQLYACPHCGNKKAMLSMMSCNTFFRTLWSDGRSIDPMRNEISKIQKCESCGSYSLFSEWKECGCDKNNYNGATGELTYEESREAYIQLMESDSYDDEDILTICLEYIKSYNDYYHRSEDAPKRNDDFLLFKGATENAIKRLGDDADSLIIKGELHRERKEFSDARKYLHQVCNDGNRWIVEPLLYFCNHFDFLPFLLVKDGKKIDWDEISYYSAIVEGELVGKREKRYKEAAAFIETLHEKRREDIFVCDTGDIYENGWITLLKILDDCPEHYEIPNGTQHIAEYACYRNFHLKSVVFSSSIRSIGARAFWGCKNLQSYSLLSETRIISIGDEAFMNCKKLDSISSSFLQNVRFIGRCAFSGMDSLTKIELPESLLEIPDYCFGCDYALQSVNMPSAVKSIGEGAFFFTGITNLSIPDSVTTIGNDAFSFCKKLTDIKLSKSLKRIPEGTFSTCESLPYIEIPSSVEEIGERCFQGTPSLKTIRFRGKVKHISISAFKDSGIETIIVPWYLQNHYRKLFPNISIKASWQ